jgi:hypothetical protein
MGRVKVKEGENGRLGGQTLARPRVRENDFASGGATVSNLICFCVAPAGLSGYILSFQCQVHSFG